MSNSRRGARANRGTGRATEASESTERKRNWCFTINNPNFDDCEDLRCLKFESKFMIIGNEHAWKNGRPQPMDEETGRPQSHHFQGFVILKNAKTFSALKRILRRAHLAQCRGTADQNIAYCLKEGDTYEVGQRPMSQEEKGAIGRSKEQERWAEIRELSKKRKYDELEEKYPRELTLYAGHIDRIAMTYADNLDMDPGTINGTWIYGPSGTGKTFYAIKKVEPDRKKVYLKDLTQWWDGYRQEQHTLVVIDDMDIYNCKLARELKIWVQEYEFPAQYKGGYRTIRPPQIIVTSNYRICDIWDDHMTRTTFWRRFKQMVKYHKDEDPVEDVNYETETREKTKRTFYN